VIYIHIADNILGRNVCNAQGHFSRLQLGNKVQCDRWIFASMAILNAKFIPLALGLGMVLCWLIAPVWATAGGDPSAASTRPTKIAPRTLAGDEFLTIPGDQWKLLWDDEFDGDHLDPTKWTSGLSWSGDDGSHRHHNSSYASYIVDDDAILGGGMLELLTRKMDVVNPRGKVYHYTQAFIQTDGKFSYQYGYCEIRAEAPTDCGPGVWPAFWLLSRGWPPEDDVAEFWTGRPQPHLHQGYAYRDSHGKVQWVSRHVDAIPTGFHTYGMEWGPGYQLMNIDGVVTVRVYGKEVTDLPMYLILNSGVTAKPTKPTSATIFPNEFVVDYLRVYARPPVVPFHNGGFETPLMAPWTANHAQIVDGHAHSGQRSLQLSGSPASAEQEIFGLHPNATYRLSGWVDAANDGEVRLGVRDFGGTDKWAAENSNGYHPISIDFTTGAEARTATIYCSKVSGTNSAYFDDISLVAAPAENAGP
jgi:beta-glucanase (GH16 family)